MNGRNVYEMYANNFRMTTPKLDNSLFLGLLLSGHGMYKKKSLRISIKNMAVQVRQFS